MKAKTRKGNHILFIDEWSNFNDNNMIINFEDKYTYVSFKQLKEKLI